jgi:signal transduction histidine kinase
VPVYTAQNLKDVMGETIEVMRFIASNKNVKIHSTAKYEEVKMFKIDANRVQQVVTNLVSNAIKFSVKGQNIIVNFSAHYAPQIDGTENKRSIVINVIDEGIGMTELECSQLFSPFFKTKDKTSKDMNPSGHGLGLCISKEIAQILKGDITCYSKPGIGSQFTFTFLAEKIFKATRQERKKKKNKKIQAKEITGN